MGDDVREPLDILFVEDSETDVKLMAHHLRRHGMAMSWERVDSVEGLREALARRTWHLVISDSSVPRLSPVGALALTRRIAPTVPFVVVSGTIVEEVAVLAIRLGAADWVSKDNLDRLGPVVLRELGLAAEKAERIGALTPRQREVLRLIALGHTSRRIASHLEVSVKTVESHRAQIMERLGVRNLAGLVRHAVRVGLVSADE